MFEHSSQKVLLLTGEKNDNLREKRKNDAFFVRICYTYSILLEKFKIKSMKRSECHGRDDHYC